MTIWKLMAINTQILYKLRLHKSNCILAHANRQMAELFVRSVQPLPNVNTDRRPIVFLCPQVNSQRLQYENTGGHVNTSYQSDSLMWKSEGKLKYKLISSCLFCLIFLFCFILYP